MGLHSNTVFKNSCLKVPINPLNRLPSASYERSTSKEGESKIILESPIIQTEDEKNPISFREFYKSIPDYKDVNHLSNQEFYMKLENLRQNKYKLLLKCKNRVSCSNEEFQNYNLDFSNSNHLKSATKLKRCDSSQIKDDSKRNFDKYSIGKEKVIDHNIFDISDIDSMMSFDNLIREKTKPHSKITLDVVKNTDLNETNKRDTFSHTNILVADEDNLSYSKSWSKDLNSPSFFLKSKQKEDSAILSYNHDSYNDNLYKRSYSVPTSPVKKTFSPQTNVTIPEPFKMTERDDVNKVLKEMKDFSKELKYNFLQSDLKKKAFKANPVPIESRILLYDKILEDQELRRSISKLQSAAELQAQMKPFKFTVREEKYGNLGGSGCRRLCRSNPQLTTRSYSNESELFKSKKFKAKPVPRNLFSNYIYDRMREDEFYRTLNRRIRAEEMLKAASLPPSMAKREKNHKTKSSKCKQYHNLESSSDSNSTDRLRRYQNLKMCRKNIENKSIRNTKLDKELDILKDELLSPVSKSEKLKKTEQMEELKKIYGSNSSEPATSTSSGNNSRSAVDYVNRSNLAAILRIESSKKKLEADILKRLEEERFQSEIKWRDSVLRRKPAWKSIKYSHAEDLAMRLQMRRDEERLKREQFLHEMELMYGRVHRQPMMFERCYSPRKGVKQLPFCKSDDFIKSIEKPKSALMKRTLSSNVISPNRSRKVSINEMAETICNEIDDYSYKDNFEDDMSKSVSEISESIPEQLQDDRK